MTWNLTIKETYPMGIVTFDRWTAINRSDSFFFKDIKQRKKRKSKVRKISNWVGLSDFS